MKNCSQFSIQTGSHTELISITHEVTNLLPELGLQDGLVHIFVKHTTCGLTINENADPAVVHDLLARLDKTAPWTFTEDRHQEGNSAAHLKSTILGSSVTVPVNNGNLLLGTWQGIFFGEFDGPRTRKVLVTAIHSAP